MFFNFKIFHLAVGNNSGAQKSAKKAKIEPVKTTTIEPVKTTTAKDSSAKQKKKTTVSRCAGKKLQTTKPIQVVNCRPPRGRPKASKSDTEIIIENEDKVDPENIVKAEVSTGLKRNAANISSEAATVNLVTNSVIEKHYVGDGNLTFDQFTKWQGSTHDLSVTNANILQSVFNQTLTAMTTTVGIMAETVRSSHGHSKKLIYVWINNSILTYFILLQTPTHHLLRD